MANGELQYLNLIKSILENGVKRQSRNAETLSIFAPLPLNFDLKDGFPLITTKKVPFRLILEELLWFCRGSTDVRELQSKNVHIWDSNSSREYLDSVNLKHLEEGDIGPGYGFQWRHFGADYGNCHTNYKGKGTDQLQNIQDLIIQNPYSRRIFLSAWNPNAMQHMALPPCHVSYQFYVRDECGKQYLDCQMYQRSCDVMLGLPFNIASTALLTTMLAVASQKNPGRCTITLGDAHVYTDHVSGASEQINRTPTLPPKLEYKPALPSYIPIDSFTEYFKYENWNLLEYNPHKSIKMKMIA